MKNKIFTKLLFACSLAVVSGTGLLINDKSNNTLVIETEAADDYYSSIDDSLTGTALLNALNTLNNSKRKRTVSYAGMRTFAAKCDADPDGSGKIISFYDNKLIGPSWDSGATWNREHVWPNIRGGDKVEQDAHMVRPAATSTNSGRGSKGFSKDAYDPGQFVEYYRGSAARIIFYAAIADTSLTVVDYPFNFDGIGGGNGGYPADSMGCLSEMLEWNLQYRPDSTSFTGANEKARKTEVNRNNVIQNDSDGQGNRNPFIDHPEYACRIWGNTNAKTKAICGSTPTPTPTPVDDSSLTLDKTSIPMREGYSTSIKATSSDSSTITWQTSNAAVVTLNSTTTQSDAQQIITAVKEGTATITASATINGTTINKTCSVTVSKKEEKSSGGGGCGGSIIATSSMLFTTSLLGTFLLLKRRKNK